MNQLINVLIYLAAGAFLVGTLGRFFLGGFFLGLEPVVFWRGAMGFLVFAITLILLQIREKTS